GGVFSSSSSSKREVTWEELSQHDEADNCWTAVRQQVYDVTKFANHHPGGPRTIYMACGKDCTEVFDHVHPKVKPEILLFKDHVGKILGDAPEEQIAGRKNHASEGSKNENRSSNGSSTTYSPNYESQNKQEVVVKEGEVW
ncbi:hypothetical protein FOZ62_013422, partial [Perkinsus olseni]